MVRRGGRSQAPKAGRFPARRARREADARAQSRAGWWGKVKREVEAGLRRDAWLNGLQVGLLQTKVKYRQCRVTVEQPLRSRGWGVL